MLKKQRNNLKYNRVIDLDLPKLMERKELKMVLKMYER